VTPRWFILGAPAVTADGFGATMGKKMPEVLKADPSGVSQLIFTSRSKEADKEVVVPIDCISCEEFANAFELDDGRVILDIVAADRWDAGVSDDSRPHWEVEDPSQRPRRRLVRYEVDLSTKTYTSRELCGWHMGFTSVSKSVVGKRHRYIFGAVTHGSDVVGPMAGVAKVDTDSGEVDSWVPGPMEFGGEPLLVPREGAEDEDDAWLITVVFDGAAERSDVVVLDARNVSQGPVCRFPLQKPVPHGLRSTWAEGMTYTSAEMKRKFVLLRMFNKKAGKWNASESSFSMIAKNPFFAKQGIKMR